MGIYCFIVFIWCTNSSLILCSLSIQLFRNEANCCRGRLIVSYRTFWNTETLPRLNRGAVLSAPPPSKCLKKRGSEVSDATIAGKKKKLLQSCWRKVFPCQFLAPSNRLLLSGDKVSQYEVSVPHTQSPPHPDNPSYPRHRRRANGWRWMPPLNHDSSPEVPQSMASLKVNVAAREKKKKKLAYKPVIKTAHILPALFRLSRPVYRHAVNFHILGK